jgi:dTDP-glucose 4,6-dehydratase
MRVGADGTQATGRVLVTGGHGFIGSCLVRRLVLDESVRVLDVDKVTYAADSARLGHAARSPLYEHARIDICDGPALTSALARFEPDIVYHLAAESHVDRSIDGPMESVRTNFVGTASVLEAARSYWSKLDSARREAFRVVHVSTDEVYGTLPLEGEAKFRIGDPYAPNSPYSAAKAGADHLARAWWQTYGLPVTVSNCSNNFGPWQHPEKLIPTMVLAALSGRSLPIYGRGLNVRDWIHVEDHVDALLAIAKRGEPGAQYLAGGYGATSNLELVRMLCGILDRLAPDAAGPYERLVSFVADRPGHDLRYDVDPETLCSALGWRPRYTLYGGLEQTVAWYADNYRRYESRLSESGLERRGIVAQGKDESHR